MLNPKLGEGNMTAMRIHSRVNELQLWKVLFDCLLDLLPVNFEIFAGLDLSLVSDDDRVVEVLFDQNNLTVLIVLILLGFGGLFLRLEVALLDVGVVRKLFFGEGFVISASHSVALNFELCGLRTGVLDVFDGAAKFLDVVAVKKVRESDVAVFGGLDLLAEEFVLG